MFLQCVFEEQQNVRPSAKVEKPQRNTAEKVATGINAEIKRTEAKFRSNENKIEPKARTVVKTMANTSMVSSSSGVSDDLEEYEDDFEVTMILCVFYFFIFKYLTIHRLKFVHAQFECN